jgi:hypothetical protein
MLAAIVFRDHFDVLVPVASLELVFDAEVRKVDRLVEVRQIVFARPRLDFVGVPIRSPVAIRPTTIRLLQPLLVLALKFLLEDHAMDLRTGVTETLFLVNVGAIHLDVMRQLTRPAHAGLKRLLAIRMAIATLGLQDMVAAFGERYGAFSAVQRYKPRESLVSEVPYVSVMRIAGLIAPIVEIAFGHHPKCADGRECPAVVAIEFVAMIAVHHDLAFKSARQLEPIEERVSWIEVSVATLATLVSNIVAVA